MSAPTEAPSTATGLSNGRVALWLVLGTETMLFVGFAGALVVLRHSAFAPPDLGALPIGRTAFLVASSVALLAAQRRARATRPAGVRAALGAAAAAGALFLALQARELAPAADVVAAGVAALLVVHGLHVAGGLGLLAVALVRARWRQRDSLDLVGLYWHFVTVAWVAIALWLYGV